MELDFVSSSVHLPNLSVSPEKSNLNYVSYIIGYFINLISRPCGVANVNLILIPGKENGNGNLKKKMKNHRVGAKILQTELTPINFVKYFQIGVSNVSILNGENCKIKDTLYVL